MFVPLAAGDFDGTIFELTVLQGCSSFRRRLRAAFVPEVERYGAALKQGGDDCGEATFGTAA